MINIFLIPKRFEDTIGEAKCQEVLYCLFTHVMVDTVYLILTEDAGKVAIEFLGRSEVAPKGFFYHDAYPGLLVVVGVVVVSEGGMGKACFTKLMDDFRVGSWGGSQVVQAGAMGAFLSLAAVDGG